MACAPSPDCERAEPVVQHGAFPVQAVVHRERAQHGHAEPAFDRRGAAEPAVQAVANEGVEDSEGQAGQSSDTESQLDVGGGRGGRQDGFAQWNHPDHGDGDDVRAFHGRDAFHLFDLLGKALDPGIRDPLGHRGVSGRGSDGKLGAFLRHRNRDGPQQGVRRGGEAERRDDALGDEPGLGH